MIINPLIKGEMDWDVKINNSFTTVSNGIGDITTLPTTDKTSVVNAIKEVNTKLTSIPMDGGTF